MPAGDARRDSSPAGYPSTSPRWAVVGCAVVLALSVALMVSLREKAEAYEVGYAAARPGTSATVIRSEHFAKGSDVIVVQWRDGGGVLRRHQFDVDEADDFPVGSALPIRVSATQPDRAYPEDRSKIDEKSDLVAGLVVLVLATLGAAALWLRRAVQWRRASRMPAKRHRARLWYNYGRGSPIGIPWLSIEDGKRTYYQRLMWEPWVPSLNDTLVIDGRRVGRGPFVVDVPGFGRLWPAGPAKRREPWLEDLVARRHSRYRLSRLSTLVWFSSVITPLAGVVVGWLGGVVIVGYLWLFILYFGGAPTPVPWLSPRRFRRINGRGSTGR